MDKQYRFGWVLRNTNLTFSEFCKIKGTLKKNKAYTEELKQHYSSKWYRFSDLYRNLEVLTELYRDFGEIKALY